MNASYLLLSFVFFATLYGLSIILYSFFLTLILPIINLFNPQWVFEVRLSVANKSEFYHYDGIIGMSPMRGVPLAKVKYHSGEYSQNMALGNAVDYAKIFGGQVVMPS